MDPRTLYGKRCCIVEEDMEDDMEEEEVGVGFGDDGKKKEFSGVYGKRGGSSSGGGSSPPSCQVEKCGADLSDAKRYHRRHKVCEVHAKAPAVVVSGLRQRFCQQCSRFHELGEFDETKRSCRRRLAGHNERRRKSTTEPYGDSSTRLWVAGQPKENQYRQPDERGRFQIAMPGNPAYRRSQIR